MEDAQEEERDAKLQKISSDLIDDFDRSLSTFLRRPDGQLRTRVRTRETTRLTSNLLDPFQELPQLLDPHLPRWLPQLAACYLENLYTQAHRRTNPSEIPSVSPRSQLLEPLPTAICKLLYTFAKIRGPFVIIRFLPVEARHLEPLLFAVESAERRGTRPSLLILTDSSRAKAMAAEPSQREWAWEERYIVLLWLSHLLLAPFDLATISSAGPDEESSEILSGLRLSADLPGITLRILPLAIKYLACPGKERDGARHLLVRMVMRKDMQQLGLLESLVDWALASLRPKPDEAPGQHYFYIGVLSFLAGILRSSVDTSDVDKHLTAIFDAVHAVSSGEGSLSEAVKSYAVARKMVIKVIRSVAVQSLRQSPQSMAGTEMVETSISYLLECLADNDTPVRFAASKALSVITLKLDPDMAEQVVDAVIESLNRNVLYTKTPENPDCTSNRDLSAVDPLEWHGLMLTLANLLYRRSPPATQLPDIIHGLLLGLSFEKRSTSGGSIGSNVRDAACFGIWALARRYITEELLAVPTQSVIAARTHPNDVSILQILATELVVAACLDSAGNIRRGSSAALQELIGRHPNTVQEGIWVVQTVDYHAVALRTRAIQEVAFKATKLSSQYARALLDGILGWRGIGDSDAVARRVAAASFGALTMELSRLAGPRPLALFEASIRMVLEQLGTLQTRQVDERHGLVLCLAAVLDRCLVFLDLALQDREQDAAQRFIHHNIRKVAGILQDAQDTTYRRPELISEVANKLIISVLPTIQAACGPAKADGPIMSTAIMRPGFEVVSADNTESLLSVVTSINPEALPEHVRTTVQTFEPVIATGLSRSEKEVISAASEAALVLLALSSPTERERIVKSWANAIRHRPTSRTGHGSGHFFALTMAHPITSMSLAPNSSETDIAAEAMLARWASDKDIDTRVAILRSLTQSVVLRDQPLVFLDLLADGLDDYTTNARGDVGSHVRLEALRATKNIWENLGQNQDKQTGAFQKAISRLLLGVLRLAAEKLDRVRAEAHSVLALTMLPSFATRFSKLTFSSLTYFQTLLSLHTKADYLRPPIAEIATSDPNSWTSELMAGYVTSADTGNEDLVISSREALTTFCTEASSNLDAVCAALVHNLSARRGQDRVLVPTLEIIAFLCSVGVFNDCRSTNLRKLCLLVQKAGYKTGNVRKLEACVRVYGCVAALPEDKLAAPGGDETLTSKRREGVGEAKKRLGALMLHPWPRVRSLVVDQLWRLSCDEDGPSTSCTILKGVDWGRADRATVKKLVADLGLS